ncbi:hypothetical protein [Amycolatopsis sp. NPDC001319]|uniref:hypothetical protein n=1 Tax=unclassified Amycolatopsis TaxID=2618356 RepID=UPI00369AE3FE
MTDHRARLDLAALDATIARIDTALAPQRERVHLGPPNADQLRQMADQLEQGPDGPHFAEALRTAALDAPPADQPGWLARAIRRILR